LFHFISGHISELSMYIISYYWLANHYLDIVGLLKIQSMKYNDQHDLAAVIESKSLTHFPTQKRKVRNAVQTT